MSASELCRIDEIPDGGAIGIAADAADGGRDELILLRSGGRVFAYHNECPHAGRRLDYAPGCFLVRSGTLICAAHGATFAMENGACTGGPAAGGLVAVPVEVTADGMVRIVRG